MSRVPHKLNAQSGISLVEVLIVMVVISVLAALAIFNRGSANEQFQRQNASRQLKSAFERARFDSVKRRADDFSGLRPYAYVNVRSNGFTLRTFNEVSGSPVAKDEVTTFANGVTAAHFASGSIPMTVSFDRRGQTLGGVPQFLVCNVNCGNPSNVTADLVIVTATGTVNLLGGGASPPTFANTSLTGSVSSTDSINFDVVIPTPTPVP